MELELKCEEGKDSLAILVSGTVHLLYILHISL